MDVGERVGRFLLIRDVEGRIHGIVPTAISAVCDDGDGGSVLVLPAARLLRTDTSVVEMLRLLSMGYPDR